MNLLPTVDKEIFTGAEQKVEFSERRPNADDVRVEFLTSVIVLPSLSSNVSADKPSASTGCDSRIAEVVLSLHAASSRSRTYSLGPDSSSRNTRSNHNLQGLPESIKCSSSSLDLVKGG